MRFLLKTGQDHVKTRVKILIKRVFSVQKWPLDAQKQVSRIRLIILK